jgi:hypothetical protein
LLGLGLNNMSSYSPYARKTSAFTRSAPKTILKSPLQRQDATVNSVTLQTPVKEEKTTLAVVDEKPSEQCKSDEDTVEDVEPIGWNHLHAYGFTPENSWLNVAKGTGRQYLIDRESKDFCCWADEPKYRSSLLFSKPLVGDHWEKLGYNNLQHRLYPSLSGFYYVGDITRKRSESFLTWAVDPVPLEAVLSKRNKSI